MQPPTRTGLRQLHTLLEIRLSFHPRVWQGNHRCLVYEIISQSSLLLLSSSLFLSYIYAYVNRHHIGVWSVDKGGFERASHDMFGLFM